MENLEKQAGVYDVAEEALEAEKNFTKNAGQSFQQSVFDAKNYLNVKLENGETSKTLKIRLLPFPDTKSPFLHVHMHTLKVPLEISKSGWGTSNYYFYEIRNIDGREFFMQFSVSSRDIPDDLRLTCDRINQVFPSRMQKANWQGRTPFVTKHTKISDDEELSEEKVYEQLSKHFEEIKHFEMKLRSALKSMPE